MCLSYADGSYVVRWRTGRRELAAALAILRPALCILPRARAVQALREWVGYTVQVDRNHALHIRGGRFECFTTSELVVCLPPITLTYYS